MGNVSKLGCVTVQEILLKDEELPTVVNVVEFGQAGVLRVSAPPPYDYTLLFKWTLTNVERKTECWVNARRTCVHLKGSGIVRHRL